MLPIIRHRAIWFVFSGILILGSIIAVAIWGLRLGTDFTGGSLLEVRWKELSPAIESIRMAIDPLVDREFTVQHGEQGSAIVRTEAIDETKHQAITAELKKSFGEFDELRFDSVGPIIGAELLRKSLWGLAIVFIAIVLYIAWSFRRVSRPVSAWTYGIITILTGFHDVIIPLGLFALFGRFYGTEVNAAFVAAILTILGYSINDTIVVLDRVRENLTNDNDSFEVKVERSVNQTIARSLNTTLTTLIAIVAVYIFGGATTRDFALALAVGIATGAYSSIFIASPLLVMWQRLRRKR